MNELEELIAQRDALMKEIAELEARYKLRKDFDYSIIREKMHESKLLRMEIEREQRTIEKESRKVQAEPEEPLPECDFLGCTETQGLRQTSNYIFGRPLSEVKTGIMLCPRHWHPEVQPITA
jgi:hypothetical protein